jgi:CheY-like chemotaxis protein
MTPKILIVEDEVITGLYIESILRKAGYNKIRRTGTGESAIKIARNYSPEVILMDIRLAGKMDGLHAAKEIDSFSSSHIIFMTGYQIDGVKRQSEDLKSRSFIIKPIDINLLITEIRKNTADSS